MSATVLKEHEKQKIAKIGLSCIVQLKKILDYNLEDLLATEIMANVDDPYDAIEFMDTLKEHIARLDEAVDLRV